MKKSMIAALIGLAVGLGFTNVSRADDRAWNWSPIGIGIAAPAQLPFMNSDVYGIRFGGILGFNNDVYGLDCGLVEISTGCFDGIQASAFTWTEGDVYGIQFGALANMVGSKMIALQLGCVNVVWGDAGGIQFGGLVNYDTAFAGLQFGGAINWNVGSSYGVQMGLVNADQDDFTGWAVGFVNYARKFTGFQLGCFNAVDEVTGYQLGLVNACEKMHGVQFGLVNLICSSKLPIMVIANASF